MSTDPEVLTLLREIVEVTGVRGALLATAAGPVGAADHTSLQPAVATDVAKTVRRMVVASTTANAPLRELLINFGASRMMIRPLHEDAVLIALLERDAATKPIREYIDVSLRKIRRLEEPMPAVGIGEGDEVGELLAGRLGPVLREIEAVYQRYRRRVNQDPTRTRVVMHDQIREWLLCCNPSTYTLPLLLDGLSETMTDDPSGRNSFVGEVQGILRKAGALR